MRNFGVEVGNQVERATQARPVGVVESHLHEQEKLLVSAHERLSELADRIQLALRPADPGNRSGDDASVPAGSSLSARLRRHNAGLLVLIESVDALIARVDL